MSDFAICNPAICHAENLRGFVSYAFLVFSTHFKLQIANHKRFNCFAICDLQFEMCNEFLGLVSKGRMP